MSFKPGPQLHHSIPGYNPSRPILSRNNKILLASLVLGPAIAYGVLKRQAWKKKEAEERLEIEGRARWETIQGQSVHPVVVDRGEGGL